MSGKANISESLAKGLAILDLFGIEDAGFTLSEIAGLLQLAEDHTAQAGDVKERAEGKLRDLKRRIREMEQMRRSLEKLVHACSGEGPGATCPILAALTEDEEFPNRMFT